MGELEGWRDDLEREAARTHRRVMAGSWLLVAVLLFGCPCLLGFILSHWL